MGNGILLKLVIIYVYFGLGAGIGYLLKGNRERVQKITTNILINWITPFQIFFILTTSSFKLDSSFVLQICAVAAGSFAILFPLSNFFFKKMGLDLKSRGASNFLSVFPNSLYYSVPVVLALFSDELTVVPVIFSSVMLTIKGSILPYICERMGAESKTNLWKAFLKLLTFPPFLGILVAMIVISFHIPVPTDIFLIIKSPMNTIASAVGAMLIGMIIVGVHKSAVKIYAKKLGWIALWRYLISIAFFMCFVYFLKFNDFQTEIRTILLLIIAGPPAMNNVIFSLYFKFDEKLAAVGVATLTLVGLVLMPLLVVIGQLIL